MGIRHASVWVPSYLVKRARKMVIAAATTAIDTINAMFPYLQRKQVHHRTKVMINGIEMCVQQKCCSDHCAANSLY